VVPVYQVANGNSFEFGLTGVSIDVQSGAGGYNMVTVTRSPYAPVYPLFQGKAPLVLPARVSMTETLLSTLGATVNFDAQSFAFSNPTNLTVYYRPTTGQGLFLPQPTSYNPVTQKLSATVALSSQGNDLGEFIFGYPDLADVPYPPMLNEVENYRGLQPYDVIAPKMASGEVPYSVNEQLPILLSWSPKGFARYYQFQISTNLDFTSNLVSVGYQTDAYYVWNGAAPNTTYYYRAMTVNEGGQSGWSVGSFTTVPPFISLTFPDGGEALQRGVPYFIRWNDNLAESVNIELYKGGVLVTTIATNTPSNGAYAWRLGFSLVPGSDYAIRISSSVNSALSYESDSAFSIIDPPTINAGALASLPGGQVQLALSVPGATQATVLGSTNLASWQELQTVPLVNGSGVFIDGILTNSSQRFYRLRIP
jgi:hypothetical protein